MLAYDIFTDDAFQAVEMTEVVEGIVYIPQTLNDMGIFEVEPIRTTDVGIMKKGTSLALVPTTERGSQETLPERDSRNIKRLATVNLRQRDRINAGEIQNIVREGQPYDAELDRALAEVERRQRKLMRKLELTREYHRFAALQGKLLDADGSLIMDYFVEMGFVQPAPITFDFTTIGSDGKLREYVKQNIGRPMRRALRDRGSLTPGTRIGALAGDEFFDKLTRAPEIRETFLGYQAAAALREDDAWDSFPFAGVEWINFDGTTDDLISIADDEVKFFPIGATDVYKEYRAPGEDMPVANEYGREFYSYVSPDPRPNRMAFVDVFLHAHPLFACIAPEVLLSGELA